MEHVSSKYLCYSKKLVLSLENITVLGIFLIVILVITQIFMRYVLQYSLSWSDEIARIINIWVVFLAAYIVLIKNEHVKVDYFMNYFSSEFNIKLDIFINFICCVFSFYLAVSSFRNITKLATAKTAAFGLPMPVVFTPILICSVLMISYFILSTVSIIRILLTRHSSIKCNEE